MKEHKLSKEGWARAKVETRLSTGRGKMFLNRYWKQNSYPLHLREHPALYYSKQFYAFLLILIYNISSVLGNNKTKKRRNHHDNPHKIFSSFVVH